jgi:hypothetical protein
MLLQLKLSKSLALQTAGFFYGRSTANQERGTKNQEQPRSGSQLQLTLCGPPSSEILHPSSARSGLTAIIHYSLFKIHHSAAGGQPRTSRRQNR